MRRRATAIYWLLFALWQATGFWLIFGPLVIASQQRHETLGVQLLIPGSLVAGMALFETGIPERQGLLLGSLTILLTNYLLALAAWRFFLSRAPRDRSN